jgi:hypothetical protein
MISVKKINEKIFLLLVLASMTLLYSNYYFGVQQGLVLGGGAFRLACKFFIFMFLIYVMVCNFVVTRYRLIITSFFMYISIKNILSINYLDGELMQIFNYLFFVPILFTKISYNLMKDTYHLLCVVTFAMFIYDIRNPIDAFVGGGFVGGVGNPSSFGFVLLISSVIIRDRFLMSTALRVGTIFTGAGMPVLVAGLMQLLFTFKSFGYFVLTTSIIVSILIFLDFEIAIFSGAAEHAKHKIIALTSGNFEDAYSLKNRIDYNVTGLELFTKNIVHILIGSIGEPVIFTGDGYYIALLASYGLIGFILFLLVILRTQFYSWSKNYSVNSSRYIIMIFLYGFITNRLIDYWPLALIFFLALIHSNESEIYD